MASYDTELDGDVEGGGDGEGGGGGGGGGALSTQPSSSANRRGKGKGNNTARLYRAGSHHEDERDLDLGDALVEKHVQGSKTTHDGRSALDGFHIAEKEPAFEYPTLLLPPAFAVQRHHFQEPLKLTQSREQMQRQRDSGTTLSSKDRGRLLGEPEPGAGKEEEGIVRKGRGWSSSEDKDKAQGGGGGGEENKSRRKSRWGGEVPDDDSGREETGHKQLNRDQPLFVGAQVAGMANAMASRFAKSSAEVQQQAAKEAAKGGLWRPEPAHAASKPNYRVQGWQQRQEDEGKDNNAVTTTTTTTTTSTVPTRGGHMENTAAGNPNPNT